MNISKRNKKIYEVSVIDLESENIGRSKFYTTRKEARTEKNRRKLNLTSNQKRLKYKVVIYQYPIDYSLPRVIR
tara:strand:- start:96 stop:317 length:222 start_codon:yes stop_codon:yes gene_type:complete